MIRRIDGRQASNALSLLGWAPERLALESGVELSSIYVLVRLGSAASQDDARIKAAFEEAGVEFPSGSAPVLKW